MHEEINQNWISNDVYNEVKSSSAKNFFDHIKSKHIEDFGFAILKAVLN